MSKEYNIDKFKIIDDGYVLEIYIQSLDKFNNPHYSSLNSYKYKDNPSVKLSTVPYMNILGFENNKETGLLLKQLLEENEHLKFYKKVDKELK